MKVSTKAFVVATALSIALSVQAAPGKWQVAVKQKAVSFGDLNLQEEAGASLLLRRLTLAAKYVCSDASTNDAEITGRSLAVQQCRQTALEKAVVDVNHPVVTAMYESKRRVAPTRLASR